MLSNLFTRRAFAGHLATLFPGLGLAAALPASAVAKSKEGEVQKLTWEGKPADPSSFITPLIIQTGVIYISDQCAHSSDSDLAQYRAQPRHSGRSDAAPRKAFRALCGGSSARGKNFRLR